MPKSKNQQNWRFSPPEDDRINRSRRILARKRIPLVCYSTPNLALVGKMGRYRSTQKSKFTQNWGFWPPKANKFPWNLPCKCRPWVCSCTPNLTLIGKRGLVQESPKCQQELISRGDSERERFYDDIVHVEASAYAHWTDFLSMLIYAAANQGRSSTSFIASQHNRTKLFLEHPCN